MRIENWAAERKRDSAQPQLLRIGQMNSSIGIYFTQVDSTYCVHLSRGAAEECSPARKRGGGVMLGSEPRKGRKKSLESFAPLALDGETARKTPAYGRGYILPPFRG
jgi:hypothetical protein